MPNPKKLKPFAFLGYERGSSNDPIIVELPGGLDLQDMPNGSKLIDPDPAPDEGVDSSTELVAIADNPTWVYINGRWYRIG